MSSCQQSNISLWEVTQLFFFPIGIHNARKMDITGGCTMVRWERSFNGKHWIPINDGTLKTLERNYVNQSGAGRYDLESETADFDEMKAYDGQSGRPSQLRRVEFFDVVDYLLLFKGVDLTAGFPQYVRDIEDAVKTAWQAKTGSKGDPPIATVFRQVASERVPVQVFCYSKDDFDVLDATYTRLARRPSTPSLHPGLKAD